MLVVKHGHGNAVLLEDIDALPEELIPRIEFLSLVVIRVFAVLADDQHRIHGQPVGTAAQRPGYGVVYVKPEFPCAVPALVTLRPLVHVERNDTRVRAAATALHTGTRPRTGPRYAARGRGSDRWWRSRRDAVARQPAYPVLRGNPFTFSRRSIRDWADRPRSDAASEPVPGPDSDFPPPRPRVPW